MPTCPNCGQPYEEGPEGARYCERCGYYLTREPEKKALSPEPVANQKPPSGGGRSNRSLIIVVAVLVLIVALFGALYVQSTGTSASLSQTISSQATQILSQSSRMANLSSSVILYRSQVAKLMAIAGLSNSTKLVSSQTFSTGSGGITTVVSLTAAYAGYVSVTVTSASDPHNMRIETNSSFAAGINSYYGGFYAFDYMVSNFPFTFVYPVIPGSVNVYLITSDSTAQSATMSVVYYY